MAKEIEKEIDIVINKDGTITADQIGWEGKDCDRAIDDLLKSLGGKVKSTKKQEYYKKGKVKVNKQVGH